MRTNTLTDRESATLIVNATVVSGGTTYLTTTDEFLTSVSRPTFIVGGVVPSKIVSTYAFGSNDVLPVLRQARAARAALGTWVHDGNVYLDLVEVYDDLDLALKVARERGELAIWDALAEAEIPASPVAA